MAGGTEKKRDQTCGVIRIKEMDKRVEKREDEIKSQAKVFSSPVCHSLREEIIHQVNGEINHETNDGERDCMKR